MGLIGVIVKAVGGSAVDAVIDGACQNLENFAKSVGVGKRLTWSYDIVFKGKTLAALRVGVKKTRSRVIYYVGTLEMSFDLSKIHPGCVAAVNTFLGVA